MEAMCNITHYSSKAGRRRRFYFKGHKNIFPLFHYNKSGLFYVHSSITYSVCYYIPAKISTHISIHMYRHTNIYTLFQ
jgi:hypothetical protein